MERIPAEIYDPIWHWSQVYSVDPYLALAVAWKESADTEHPYGNPQAQGDWEDKTATFHSIGLFQLHDQGLGAGMSKAERLDPNINTKVALRMLRENLDYFRAERYDAEYILHSAIAAHNQGRSGVERDGWTWNLERYLNLVMQRQWFYQVSGIVREPLTASYSSAEVLAQLDALWGYGNQAKEAGLWVHNHVIELKKIMGLES